jgi:hypothetical protein
LFYFGAGMVKCALSLPKIINSLATSTKNLSRLLSTYSGKVLPGTAVYVYKNSIGIGKFSITEIAEAAKKGQYTTLVRQFVKNKSYYDAFATTVSRSSRVMVEFNGFKFTEFYYARLWATGRKYPTLIAKQILTESPKITPDPQGFSGFSRYEIPGWEMIYNPTTKEISHLQPLR